VGEDRLAEGGRVAGGRLHEELARLVVGLTHEYTGRGPTKARAHVEGNLVVVLMGDTLTKGERSLARDGKDDLVLQVRQNFQRTMREDLTEGVERLTGRRVVAFMSDNHIDPDMACEVFVLEPPADSEPRDGYAG
jgi:uncharacterized protein YbcI